MIDLHMHTKYSDGSSSLIELLKLAEEKKLEYISITDHNTCMAYKELESIEYKKYYTGKIIKGVELNTSINGINIELLGYGIDTDKLQEKLLKLYPSKESRNNLEKNQLIEICNKLGIILEDSDMKYFDKEKHKYFSTYLLQQIKKNSENKKYFLSEDSWNDAMVFYRKEMCNKDSKFYIDNTKLYPTIEETIKLIKDVGGLVFVPHIYIYGENSNTIFKEITEKYKVDGFECYYSKFTKEQSDSLLDYCIKNNYYISGGSDFHGSVKPDIQMGIGKENLNIERKIIDAWIEKVKCI